VETVSEIHAKALLDDVLQVHAPPAYHAVDGAVRTFLDDCSQFGPLLG
jgi:hypothetical protein